MTQEEDHKDHDQHGRPAAPRHPRPKQKNERKKEKKLLRLQFLFVLPSCLREDAMISRSHRRKGATQPDEEAFMQNSRSNRVQGLPQGTLARWWFTFKDCGRPFNRFLYQGDPRPFLFEFHQLKQLLFWGSLMTAMLVLELVIMHYVSFPSSQEKDTFRYKIRYPEAWKAQIFTEMSNSPREHLSNNRTLGKQHQNNKATNEEEKETEEKKKKRVHRKDRV